MKAQLYQTKPTELVAEQFHTPKHITYHMRWDLGIAQRVIKPYTFLIFNPILDEFQELHDGDYVVTYVGGKKLPDPQPVTKKQFHEHYCPVEQR